MSATEDEDRPVLETLGFGTPPQLPSAPEREALDPAARD